MCKINTAFPFVIYYNADKRQLFFLLHDGYNIICFTDNTFKIYFLLRKGDFICQNS